MLIGGKCGSEPVTRDFRERPGGDSPFGHPTALVVQAFAARYHRVVESGHSPINRFLQVWNQQSGDSEAATAGRKQANVESPPLAVYAAAGYSRCYQGYG